jgi:DNA-binding SARP family transcriptional activator
VDSGVNRQMDYRLLGPPEVLDEGRVVALTGKGAAVLALLVLNANRVVPRTTLMDAVWPGESASARRNLEVHVSRLRKALPSGRGGTEITSRGGGYLLAADPESVDVNRFERMVESGQRALEARRHEDAIVDLRAGLELWRGRPLEGLEDYAFAAAEAERLEDVRLGALEARFEAELALGRHQAVIAEIRALANAHPARETLRYQLMIALYRNGRQADALAATRRRAVTWSRSSASSRRPACATSSARSSSTIQRSHSSPGRGLRVSPSRSPSRPRPPCARS